MISVNFKIFGSILLIMGIVLFSCKKEALQFPFQKDTKTYFSFKNNAQWVYQNEINAADMDVVTASAAASGFADVRDDGQPELSSITLTGTHSPQLIVRAEAIPNQGVDRIAIVTKQGNLFISGPILLNIDGVLNGEDSSTAIKLVTFEVGGVQYQDIWEISIKSHPVFKKLWFAKERGIIKKMLVDGEVYNLTSYTPGN